MRPYYVARAVGGLFFLIGACLGAYNIWMTIRRTPEADLAQDRPTTPEGEAGERSVPAE